jgi:hypothetical protein
VLDEVPKRFTIATFVTAIAKLLLMDEEVSSGLSLVFLRVAADRTATVSNLGRLYPPKPFDI